MIGFDTDLMNDIVYLSEGNPGAAIALADITKIHAIVDPDSMLGAKGFVHGIESLSTLVNLSALALSLLIIPLC